MRVPSNSDRPQNLSTMRPSITHHMFHHVYPISHPSVHLEIGVSPPMTPFHRSSRYFLGPALRQSRGATLVSHFICFTFLTFICLNVCIYRRSSKEILCHMFTNGFVDRVKQMKMLKSVRFVYHCLSWIMT